MGTTKSAADALFDAAPHEEAAPPPVDAHAIFDAAPEEHPVPAEAPRAPPAAPPPSFLSQAGSKTLDAVRGLGQGTTLGFGDELAGAGGALIDKATGDKRSLAELYRESRDFARGDNASAKERSPYVYGGAELAGAMATPGGAGGGLGRAMLLGGAMGLGSSKADLTQGEYGRAALDTGVGVAAGGAGQQVGSRVLSPLARVAAARLQPALKETAENSAVKAVGAIQSDLKKIRGPITGDNGLGRKILDAETPAGKSLLGFGSGKKAIKEGAEAIVEDSGEKVGGILRALDEKSGKAFDWKRASARLDAAVDDIDPVETQILGKALEDMKKAFEVAEKRGGGFALANKMKTTLYKNIGHWVPDPSIKAELRQKLAGVFNREIEAQLEEKYGKVALEHLQEAAAARAGGEGAEAGAQASRALPSGDGLVPPGTVAPAGAPAGKRVVGVPVNPDDAALAKKLGAEALNQFQGAKKSFGLGAEVEGLAEKGHIRELGNRHISLTDYLTAGFAGAAGLGGHGGVGLGTVALTLAHKMARERGRAAVAVSADAAQKALQRALPVLQQKGPDALGNFTRALASELAAYYDSRKEAKPDERAAATPSP